MVLLALNLKKNSVKRSPCKLYSVQIPNEKKTSKRIAHTRHKKKTDPNKGLYTCAGLCKNEIIG